MTGYRPDNHCSIPIKSRNFRFHHDVQTGTASYPKGTGGSFPQVKESEYETDLSPPSSAEVKHPWTFTYTLLYTFMVERLSMQTTLYFFTKLCKLRYSPVDITYIVCYRVVA